MTKSDAGVWEKSDLRQRRGTVPKKWGEESGEQFRKGEVEDYFAGQ